MRYQREDGGGAGFRLPPDEPGPGLGSHRTRNLPEHKCCLKATAQPECNNALPQSIISETPHGAKCEGELRI